MLFRSYETIEAVEEADVLNLGPGSWYTSVMPHLLVPSLAEAIVASKAVKSLTLNLSSTDGETKDLSLGEHLVSLHRHARSLTLDYVLVDEAATDLEPDLPQRAEDMFGAKLWERPLRSRRQGQHDSLKLAACYRDMLLDAGIGVAEQW